LIIKPFQLVATALRGALPGRTPPPSTGPKPGPKGPKPGGGRGLGLFGNLFGLVSAFLNYKNQENADAIMEVLAVALPTVGPLGIVKGLLTAGVLADQIAEVFGSNLFGKNPNIVKIVELAEKEKEKEKNKDKLKSSVLKKSEPPKPEAAKPAPTTSMIPPASDLQINAPDTQKPQDTSKPDTQKPATPAPPSPEMIKNFQMAWDNKDRPFARGRIEGAWNKMTPEQKEQAKDWAKSEGHDWTQMKLPDANISKESVKPAPAPSSTLPLMPSAPAETSSKPSTAEITPAQTTKMQTVPFNIGPEPEPKPNVVYAPSGPSAPPQQQPLSTGPASDVPLIPSSNTDNFYTLYSQINYNVVL
jgi:hypothetical protein